MKKIKLWFKKEFGVLTLDECILLDLEFCHNVFGDAIKLLNCRSIWRDETGKSYRCKELYMFNNLIQ
jgi:hypothetical protein